MKRRFHIFWAACIFLFFFLQSLKSQDDSEREKYLSQFMDKKVKEEKEKEKKKREAEHKALLEELSSRFGFIVQGNIGLEQLKEINKKLSQSTSKIQQKSMPTPPIHEASTQTKPLREQTKEELTASLAPYRSLTREESLKILQIKLKDKPFLTHPKIIKFIDELIRRPEALEKAVSIVKGRQEIVSYIIFLVITFFLGMFYRKVHANKKSSGIQKIMDFLSRFVVMNTLRIGIFVFFFKKYLDDTFFVFIQVFF